MHISAFNNHCIRYNSLASVSQLQKREQRHALMPDVKNQCGRCISCLLIQA